MSLSTAPPEPQEAARKEARQCDFSGRISELQDLAEMSRAISEVARSVEVRLLGHRAPTPSIDQPATSSGPATYFISVMRDFEDDIRGNLQTIADSLNRLEGELGLTGESVNEPQTGNH